MNMEPQNLGFIGLGNIGGALAANLLADGHKLTVFDVDSAKSAALANVGARVATSPAHVALSADVTFLSLPSPAAMEAVAAEWLADASGSGKILVDLTTNAPATVRAVGEPLAMSRTHLVEAPVTGGAPERATVSWCSSPAETTRRWLECNRCSIRWGALRSTWARSARATWASWSTRFSLSPPCG